MEQTTVSPSRFASWVHVVMTMNDKGERPLHDKPDDLSFVYSPQSTTVAFSVANSGTCDAYPTVLDWIFCIGYTGPHGWEYRKLSSGEDVLMLEGKCRRQVRLTLQGNVLDGYSVALSPRPVLLVRVADLTTPAPTKKELFAVDHRVISGADVLGSLREYTSRIEPLQGMPGFAQLVGQAFPPV